jgi:type II secretory ATPase GspE/PulE/Tfp pilus assembly ATPase PilB-like protein
MTPKQEAFAQAVASGMNQSDAYRLAYNAKGKAAGINVSACKLMADPNVSLRVSQIRAKGAERAAVTLEGHLQTLADLRDAAEKAKQFSAAIAAEIARGKASGIHIEKSEQTVTTKALPASVDEFV